MNVGSMNRSSCIGVLGNASGWYVRDLERAANELNVQTHRNIEVRPLTFETLSVQSLDALHVRSAPARDGDAVMDIQALDTLFVRTMPLGSQSK